MNATKITFARSVCDIDFLALKKSGIECVIFDIESTLTQWGSDYIPKEVLNCITHAPLSKIGLVTNVHKRHAARVTRVARKVQAKSYQYPRQWKDRKPSGRMLRTCMAELNTTAEQSVMVGDKLFDVMAAKRAGVSQVIWVDKLPGADHWFDRLVYRRVEPFMKWLMH